MSTSIYKNLITILNDVTGSGATLLLENDKALADKLLLVESSVTALQGTVAELGNSSAQLTIQTLTDAVVSITLAENASYYLDNTALSSVTVEVGAGVSMSRVELTTGETLPVFQWPVGMVFIGDDCTNGVWSPVVSTRYSILVASSAFGYLANVLVVPVLETLQEEQ